MSSNSSLSSSAPILYLHSFPTRRSSDLDVSLPFRRPLPILAATACDALSGTAGTSIERRRPCVPRPAHLRARRATGPHRDRKSTRLNSSHPSISYAVFCLKKKIPSESRSVANVRPVQFFDQLVGVYDSVLLGGSLGAELYVQIVCSYDGCDVIEASDM